MIKLTLQIITAAVLLVAAVGATGRLIHHPRDLPLRAITPGLICVAFASSLGINGFTRKWLYAVFGPFATSIVNVQWTVMAYCFAAFFLFADKRLPPRRRILTARWEFVLLVVAAAVISWVEPAGWAASAIHDPPHIGDWATWYKAVDEASEDLPALYFSVVGIARGIRYALSLKHVWARRALWTVVTGAIAMGVGVNALSVVIYLLHLVQGASGARRYATLGHLYLTGLLAGQFLLAVGIVFPTLATTVTKIGSHHDQRLQLRYRRRSNYLWCSLTAAFPQIVLAARFDDTPSNNEEQPLNRAESEITDGLARLAPYYLAGGLNPAEGPQGLADPSAAAQVVHGALRAVYREHAVRWAGGSERSAPPYPRLIPDLESWRKQSRWMAELSRELEGMPKPRGPAEEDELAR
jgi:hypothetical protein